MLNLQSPKVMMGMSRGVFVEDEFKNVMTIGGGNLVCCKKMHKVAVRLLGLCWLIQGSRCFISPMIGRRSRQWLGCFFFNIFFPMIMMVVWITQTVDMVDDE